MNTITINYTYYNNKKYFEDLVYYYYPFKESYNFTVIDDGSQDFPISREWVPEWWRILRIPEDYGWGNEVARNILMKETKTDWNVLIDVDYRLTYSTLDYLNYMMDEYDPNVIQEYQFEKGRKNWSHPEDGDNHLLNQFIMSKQTFDKSYGYDMAFAWVWGNDISLFRQFPNNNTSYIPGTELDWYTDFATERNKNIVNGEIDKGRKRLTKDIEQLFELYKKDGYDPVLKKWPSEEIRQKHVKPFPKYIEL